MAKKKSNNKTPEGGSLTEELAVSLNKKFSKEYNQVAYFLNGGDESPTDVTSWVSTGCTPLDLAISNRPNGGLPVSKIVEITGLEQSGKSLLAAHVIASTQKQGGVAIYVDTESALDAQFLTAIGVDVDKMLYIPLDTIEDVFEAMEDIIVKIREKQKDRLVTIVVDSVAAATTKIQDLLKGKKVAAAEGKELKEAKATIKFLKTELNEVNLLNSKLLYTNKIFKAKNLTENQKIKVLKAFDKAESVKEAKVIYESLNENLVSKKSKSSIKESMGFASKPAGVAPKRTITENVVEEDAMVSRFKKLAGLK